MFPENSSPHWGEGLVGGLADEASPKGEGEGVAPFPDAASPLTYPLPVGERV